MRSQPLHHAYELERLLGDLERAARTVRSSTRAERAALCRELGGLVRASLEPDASRDESGLEAIQTWLDALCAADPDNVDELQELLYGLDALVRVHVSREWGTALRPPAPEPPLLW